MSSSESDYVPNEHENVANMSDLQYHLRKCYVKTILLVWSIKMKSLLTSSK